MFVFRRIDLDSNQTNTNQCNNLVTNVELYVYRKGDNRKIRAIRWWPLADYREIFEKLTEIDVPHTRARNASGIRTM